MWRSAFYKISYTVIMFLAALVLSNLLLPERFGTISLIVLNASLLSLITGLGTDSMILHMLVNGKWSLHQALSFMWKTLAMQIGLFLALEVLCFAIWNRTLLSSESAGYLTIDLIYFGGLVLVEKYIVLFYALHKARTANSILALISLVYLAVLLLLYYQTKANLFRIMQLFALQSMIQGILLMLVFHLGHKKEKKVIPGEDNFSKALKLSSVVMITNVVQLLAYRIDFWILKSFYSNFELGVYAQANKFANLIWIVPNILAQLLIPKFAQMTSQEVASVFRAVIYLNLLIVAVTIVGTDFFYYFYLDKAYAGGLSAFFLMLPGYFFWAMVIYYAAYFSWAGKFYNNLVGSLCCLVLITGADLLLIPSLSVRGAAIANSIAYVGVFTIYLFILLRKSAFRFRDLLLLQRKDIAYFLKFLR